MYCFNTAALLPHQGRKIIERKREKKNHTSYETSGGKKTGPRRVTCKMDGVEKKCIVIFFLLFYSFCVIVVRKCCKVMMSCDKQSRSK